VASDSSIIALSREKKTANEAQNICSNYGGGLFRNDKMETSIRSILNEEYLESN